MRKNAIIILIALMLLSNISLFNVNSESIKEKTIKILNKEDIDTIEINEKDFDENRVFLYHWPNNDSIYPFNKFPSPIVTIGLEFYEKEYDTSGNRNCWEYKIKLMWLVSKYNIYGEYEKDPYYWLTMDYYPEVNYGCWLGESFKYGGWNTTEVNSTGDLEDWANILSTAIISLIIDPPYANFPFFTGISMARAMGLIDEEPKPIYEWTGRNIYNAAGSLEYDFHVEPNTEFKTTWCFSYDYTPNGYKKKFEISFKDTTPSSPKVEWYCPQGCNFGENKINNESTTLTYRLKNEINGPVHGKIILSNQNDDEWILKNEKGNPRSEIDYSLGPNEEKTVKVTLIPKTMGEKQIELQANNNGKQSSIILSGKGYEEKSKYEKYFQKYPIIINFISYLIN